MTGFLHGLHDPNGEETMAGKPGWIVHTVALKDVSYQDYSSWQAQGFKNMVRLNYGYHPDGTIPTSDKYQEFATQCAYFCADSPGIDWVIIGNEPNHLNEQPNGQEIEPAQYAKCFDLCYKAIRNAAPHVKVMLAAVAPWDNTSGEWTEYYQEVLAAISKCDGFALHAYTHGADPSLITSMAVVEGWIWNFRVYQQTLSLILDTNKFPLHLPAFITEADQCDSPWADTNSGWVQSAYEEINAHNGYAGNRPIEALCLYRWQKHDGDQWWIEGKNGVIDDFKAAVAHGYLSGAAAGPTPTPPTPTPTPPTPTPTPPRPAPGPTPPLYSQSPYLDYWDTRLDIRKTKLTVGEGAENQLGYHCTYGKWYDEGEAQGRVNIFISVYDEFGQLAVGVPVKFFWGSGFDTKYTEIKSDPWLGSYSLDFPMKNVAPSYGIQIMDGVSDVLDGMGLGSIEQPDYTIHTCYWFKLHKLLSTTPEPPIPPDPPDPPDPPIDEEIIHPLPGCFISQHFYQNPADYSEFGMPGHDGTDLAGKAAGTPILALADGTVAYTGYDAGYGNYVRIAHPPLGICSFYAHCQETLVRVGQVVNAGSQIALLGYTGNVDPPGPNGTHLHFEIRAIQPNGAYITTSPMPNGRIDPESWCALHGLALQEFA